jgi:predicted nucleotidyltransferase
MRDYKKLTTLMVEKLKQREHHGDWNTGNKQADTKKLLAHISKEMLELELAVNYETDEDVVQECIDIINLAAMIIEVVSER